MPTLDKVQKTKTAGFVSDRPSTHEDRIKRDEEELAELEKELLGENKTTEEDKSKEENKEEKENLEEENKEDKGLKGEEKTYKKRYGDLRRHQQKVEQDLKSKISDLEEKLNNKNEGLALPKSDEDIEKWMRKYPDVAGIVTTLVAKETDKRLKSANLSLEEIRNDQEENKLAKARQVIMKSHSDFADIEASDDFHDWVEDQPSWVANALFENSDEPQAVVRVIDLYKADTSGITPNKKKEKDAASLVDTKGKGRTSPSDTAEKGKIRESDVQEMTDAEYEKREEEILNAIREGNFIYDLSGGAR